MSKGVDVPGLPNLPFDLEYAALGLALLAVLGGVVQQFFTDSIQMVLGRLWRRMTGRRGRAIRRDEWTRYRAWVTRTYRTVMLGFLEDASVTLNDVYVPLQYEQDGRRVDIYRDIQGRLRTVVVGAAGAGKSMLLRHSMLRWAEAPAPFDRVPVLIELARYNRGGRSIEQLVVEALARRDDEGGGRRLHKRRPARPLVEDAEQVVVTALATGQLCLFLDGLDEVMTDHWAALVLDIREFAEQHPNCQIVVTCRDAVYDNDLHPVFDRQIRVAGFDDAGIRQFLRLWFSRHGDAGGDEGDRDAVGNPAADSRQLVEQLMAALRANPTLMRLARSPLMLTMITSLHDADPGAGPTLTNSRAEFYELAVTHLLRRDRDLGRNRSLARYRAGHKLMALRAIALAAQGAPDAGSTNSDHRVISEEKLYAEMNRLLPRLRLVEADLPRMVNEIVDRSGLLVRIDDSNLLYEFAHLTLQEYLAAVELADAPDRLLALYQQRPGRWRETVKLWCAGANRDASDLMGQIFAGDSRDRLLALECVAEARQVDQDLANRIVDHFTAQLGTELPDRHLVLAALGAVAGDPGPIGQRLFVLIRNQVMAGGPTRTDAIVVLAESRRRAAIETLSELAGRLPAARAALRSAGELAIPVLGVRAQHGFVSAVDDLAAIGTPAAAVTIAEQLWGDRPVAVRAAWRLAVLVGDGEVESELSRFDPTEFRGNAGDEHDWLWAPFRPSQGSHPAIVTTMGRVGALIDGSQPAEVPEDLGLVDPRLAVGLGVRRGSFQVGSAPDGLSRQFVKAGQSLGHKRHWGGALVATEVREILKLAASAKPVLARELATATVDHRAATWLVRMMLLQLPTAVLVELAAQLWPRGVLQVDHRDWRTLNDPPDQSKTLPYLHRVALAAATTLGLGAAGVALTRSVGTLIGWWGWGPWWLAVLILLSTVAAITAFVIDEVVFPVSDVPITVAFLGGIVAAGAMSVVALRTSAGWIGWFGTISIATLVVGTTILLDVMARRRGRSLRNPYRAILRNDERIGQTSGTVIAPATPPTTVRPRQSANVR